MNLCHPLTGPVHIEGAKRGDAIAVTVVDIVPDDFAYTPVVPGFGFLRDVFPDPYIVHWELNRLEARSKDIPGIAVPNNSFMGTIGVLPGKPELDTWLKREQALADAGGGVLTPQAVDALPAALCGVDGTAKDECVRTVPPRENGGNIDTKETVVGTTLMFPCFIDGCGLFVDLPSSLSWPCCPPSSQKLSNAGRPSTCMHSEYTIILELIPRASKRVNARRLATG